MSSGYYQQEDDLFLAALASIPGLGPQRLKRLFEYYGSWQNAWEGKEIDWQKYKIPKISLISWQNSKPDFSPQNLINLLKKTNTRLLTNTCSDYPIGFNQLKDAPLLLYARGSWPKNKTFITVIGSRQPSQYGERAASKIIPPLLTEYSVVSGLALGLDSLAHRLSLQAEGHTVAILGSGLDNIYPSTNQPLAAEILKKGGLLLSEYALSAPPIKTNFIQRNRLLAAISDIIIILEANLHSGSLITARLAQKLERHIYAIPGNIFDNHAAGCHLLLQEGAKILTNANQILKNSNEIKPTTRIVKIYLNQQEQAIVDLLKKQAAGFQNINADKIGKILKLDTASVNSTLSILEIKNIVCQRQGCYYLSFLPT